MREAQKIGIAFSSVQPQVRAPSVAAPPDSTTGVRSTALTALPRTSIVRLVARHRSRQSDTQIGRDPFGDTSCNLFALLHTTRHSLLLRSIATFKGVAIVWRRSSADILK